RLARSVEPDDVRLLSEPDHLTPGISAILLRDERTRRGFVTDAVQMLERLPVHQTAKRPRRIRYAARQECADFVQQPSLELLIDTANHSLGNPSGGQTNGDRKHVEVRKRSGRFREVIGQWPSGKEVHLERAHHAFEVARLDPYSRRRVHA